MAEAAAATIEVPTESEKLGDAEITIDGDTTQVKEVSSASSAETQKKPIPAEDGIAELHAQLKVYDDRTRAAERAASEAQSQLSAVSRNATDATLNMIVSSIETVAGNSAAAKAEHQRAMESGDYAKAADALEKMADARANLLRLQERKSEVENGRGQQQVRQAAPLSKVEALATRLSAPSAAWVRAHPEIAEDFSKAELAHYRVLGAGIAVDTPAYFDRIETELGMKSVEKRSPEARIESRPVASQAPVTQSAPSLRTGEPTRQVVTLTALEREVAREMNMTDREYAIGKMEAIAEGKMGNGALRH